MKKLTFNVPEELHRELKTTAVASGTTMTELIKKEVLTALTGKRGYPVYLTPEQTAGIRAMGNVEQVLSEIVGHAIRVHKLFTAAQVPTAPHTPPAVPPVGMPPAAPAPVGMPAPPPQAPTGTDPLLAAARGKAYQDLTADDVAALLAAGEMDQETADAHPSMVTPVFTPDELRRNAELWAAANARMASTTAPPVTNVPGGMPPTTEDISEMLATENN